MTDKWKDFFFFFLYKCLLKATLDGMYLTEKSVNPNTTFQAFLDCFKKEVLFPKRSEHRRRLPKKKKKKIHYRIFWVIRRSIIIRRGDD